MNESRHFQRLFFKQFVPPVREHLRSKNLPERAMLLLDNIPSHPSEDILKTIDCMIYLRIFAQTSRHFCNKCIKAHW
jgi:hypothetical protein